MPNEATIARMMDIFTEVIDLGGVEERTAIVPNLSVTDAAPTGLTGFVIVQDDRDGDNILAKTVPGVVYANNDKVNVLFVKGTEPIAFQQGSESSSSGIWGIVPSTSTDIFYNNGDVGIGKSVAPDASLEVLSTAQAQLRLTHTEDAKFVDFTLDTNHDLTIKPSSTGQVIFQPTTDSVDFFQILDANGGNPVLNVNSTDETVSMGTTDATYVVTGTTKNTRLFVNSPDQANFHGYALSSASDTAGRFTVNSILRARAGPATVVNGDGLGSMQFLAHDGTDYNPAASIQADIDGVVSANTVPTALLFKTSFTNVLTERMRITGSGRVSIGGVISPLARLHIDQGGTGANIPVALFDQADVSEEMFEFVSTIGVGNAIEAVGAKVLTTTHFIKVTLPGSLTRYFPVGTIA